MTKNTVLVGIAIIAIAHVAAPAFGHEGHHHASFSAGEPGDA
ncbi:MAG: copper resistance protein, partial [Bradyrhizobium sp.]|nr:copper resistance protein [Bradyrhizobium sp.]